MENLTTARVIRQAGRFGWLPWVLLAALSVRVALFTGIGPTDDVVYASKAASLLRDGFDPAGDVFFARIGYVAPLAFVFAVFGITPASLALLSFASSMLLIVLAWKFGRELYSETLGLVAAVIVTILPLDIFYASNGHLDLMQAAAGSMAIYLLWRSRDEPTENLALRYLLVSGGLLGFAHLIKETAFFFLIPGLWLVRERKYWRRGAVVVATYAAIIGAEMLVYALFRGNALTRYHLIHAQVEGVRVAGSGGVSTRAGDLLTAILGPEGHLFKFIGSLIWLAIPGILWGVIRDRERWGWLAAWLLGIVGLIGFWPRTIIPFHPALGLYDRFFAALIVPGALFAARFVVEVGRRGRRPIGWMVLAVIVPFNLLCAVINWQDARRSRAGAEWAHQILANRHERVVMTDVRTAAMLLFLSKYNPSYELRDIASDAPPPGTLLIDNQLLVAAERTWDGSVPPPWWSSQSPPREVIAETRIPPRFSLRGRYQPVTRVVLSRVLPRVSTSEPSSAH